jgi:hypothetical protein
MKPFLIRFQCTNGLFFGLEIWAETEIEATKIARVINQHWSALGFIFPTPRPKGTEDEALITATRPTEADVASGKDPFEGKI